MHSLWTVCIVLLSHKNVDSIKRTAPVWCACEFFILIVTTETMEEDFYCGFCAYHRSCSLHWEPHDWAWTVRWKFRDRDGAYLHASPVKVKTDGWIVAERSKMRLFFIISDGWRFWNSKCGTIVHCSGAFAIAIGLIYLMRYHVNSSVERES